MCLDIGRGTTMDLRDKLHAGAPCLHCVTGMVTLVHSVPDRERVGHSNMLFGCSACPAVSKQSQDDRFL